MGKSILAALQFDTQNTVRRRQLIGTCVGRVSSFRRQGTINKNSATWCELYGGATGHAWVGDIFFSLELVKKDEAGKIPLITPAPPRKEVIVQLAVHSLRDLPAIENMSKEEEALGKVIAKQGLGELKDQMKQN